MKGKISLKTIIVFVTLILVIVLGVLGINTFKTFMSGAAGGAEPQNMGAVSSDGGDSATLTWSSDKETIGIVEYGTNPASLILRIEETASSMNHDVTLNNLRPGITYYYRVRVGEEIFDNSGAQYSFKTNGTPESSVADSISPTPALLPSVNILKPTVVPSPISTNSSATNVSCNRTTDYNKDGIVNSLDYPICMKNGGTAAVVTPTTTKTAVSCAIGTSGVVNSIDRIKCLQNNTK